MQGCTVAVFLRSRHRPHNRYNSLASCMPGIGLVAFPNSRKFATGEHRRVVDKQSHFPSNFFSFSADT